MTRSLPIAALISVLAAVAYAQSPAEDPFATPQLAQMPAAPPSTGTFTVGGFVDVGYINITQSKVPGPGGAISWAYGNSQFGFASAVDTFTVNQLNLTLAAERELGSMEVGAVGSISFYPSRDVEAYGNGNSDRPYQVDRAYLFTEWPSAWSTRVQAGRWPGFLTLEQQESAPPDFRLIGHTYVFQAGGGYPYGLSVFTTPYAGITLKASVSNGGVGDYSFYPGDRSTTNLAVANDRVQKGAGADKANGKTGSLALEWVLFDRPAGAGTLRIGGGGADNPSLTYNTVKQRSEPYSFTNLYADYQLGSWELRTESATLRAYYTGGLGLFQASMYSVLISFEAGANHLVTLRGEGIAYRSDKYDEQGQGTKAGVTYRYRMAPPMVLKLEYVEETQTPQFWQASRGKALVTDVVAVSWVYAF